MERESLLPSPPENISKHDLTNFSRHFEKRFEIESGAFGELTHQSVYSGIDKFVCQPHELNSKATVEFVKKEPADVCIVFGDGADPGGCGRFFGLVHLDRLVGPDRYCGGVVARAA
jgi:hypothetical protein